MQLRFIRRHPSDLSRLLLQEARRRGLATTFALATAIKVDPDSVSAVLAGGRPNARTVQRYRSFLRLSTEQLLQLKDNVLPEQILSLVQPASRGRAAPTPLDATDFAQELQGLHQLLQGLGRSLSALGEELQRIDHRVTSLTTLAAALDGNPELRELLAADGAARRAAMAMLRSYTGRGALVVASAATSARSLSSRRTRRIAKRA